jgi:hypothetical protein
MFYIFNVFCISSLVFREENSDVAPSIFSAKQ